MRKNNLFPQNIMLEMSWEEVFEISKMCFENAERLYKSALLLSQNDFPEQAFNNSYIACEEYYKAINFEAISFIKLQNKPLNPEKLKTFIQEFANHKFKFQEIFNAVELNIPNVSIKTNEEFDDSLIQYDLRNSMNKTLTRLIKINPYSTKNNSLYVGFDIQKYSFIAPQNNISSEIVQDILDFCFLVKLNCQISNDETPSGKLSMIMEWGDSSL